MCQITAPPAVFLAGPLQAPLGWLLIAGFLAAAVVWAVPSMYRTYLRQHPSAIYRRVGLAEIGSALLAVCTSMVLFVQVDLPSNDALSAWEDSQGATLFASHCAVSAYAAFSETFGRQVDGPIAIWLHVTSLFVFVSLGAEITWFSWFVWRPGAQSARQ